MSDHQWFKTANIILWATAISFPVVAHNVEISNEVAATFHIEPNHNPQANQPTTAWFALTRRGGANIPLSECDCTLKIYPVPRPKDAQPILEPDLVPLNVEKYQEIPGAKIVFPQPGAYELEISGTAKDNSFNHFQLSYRVNVTP